MIGQQDIEELARLTEKFFVEFESLGIVEFDGLIILPVRLDRFDIGSQLWGLKLDSFSLASLNDLQGSVNINIQLLQYFMFGRVRFRWLKFHQALMYFFYGKLAVAIV